MDKCFYNTLIVNLSSIYFIILTGLVSFFSLITLFSLEDQIKEEKILLQKKIFNNLKKKIKKNNIFNFIFNMSTTSKEMILDQLKNPKSNQFNIDQEKIIKLFLEFI